MTYAHGIASPPTVHVQCTTPDCPAPAGTLVTLPILAPGVAGRPELLCTGCDQPLTVVEA